MPRRTPDRDEDLRRLYRVHVRAVYAFLAYSVPRETAEDLTSITFERAIKAWDRFDPQKASERTWVLTIARNAMTDHFRRQKLRNAVSTDEHPALLDRLTSEDPLSSRLRVDGFTLWLRELGPREREVLALRYGADMSAAEIADAMELSEANVHQIVSRSLKKLRRVATTADDLSGSA